MLHDAEMLLCINRSHASCLCSALHATCSGVMWALPCRLLEPHHLPHAGWRGRGVLCGPSLALHWCGTPAGLCMLTPGPTWLMPEMCAIRPDTKGAPWLVHD